MINIAIDGYSSCGKSTLAKALARTLGYIYIDTGAMYRAVALYALDHGLIHPDGTMDKEGLINALPSLHIDFEYSKDSGQSDVLLNGVSVESRIRNIQVAELASRISQLRAVRNKLQQLQRAIAQKKGVVMDGRDIGTVIMPDAELKIFMTADPEIRAKRRFEELKAAGKEISLDEVRNNQAIRDYEDTHRTEDPLRQAADALVLDNSALSPDEQLKLALDWVKKKSKQAIEV
ncbi:MAG: (d)CMP kinase [Flavobacteriales bacterium]|nr:(d)CMP kinase [Flavobacteriales bacterium]